MKAIVIGTDHPHSALYQTTLSQISGLEIVGIVDDGGAIADELRHVPVYEDHAEALSDDGARTDFTVAFVFLPADAVVPIAAKLIQAGKHIFCDKPVTRTSGELGPLIDLAARHQVAFCAGYIWRVNPIVRWIKEQITSGYVGKLQHIEARLITTTIETRGADHYLFQRERSGGGITHWLGCHHIDLLRYLTDDEVVAVSAVTETVSEAPVNVEDLSLSTLRFANGCLASLIQGYLLTMPTDDPYGASPYDMQITVRGSKGWIQWNPATTTVFMYSNDPRWTGAHERETKFELAQRPGYVGAIGFQFVSEFLSAVRTGSPSPSKGEDALAVLRIIEAIYTSADTGRVVSLSAKPE